MTDQPWGEDIYYGYKCPYTDEMLYTWSLGTGMTIYCDTCGVDHNINDMEPAGRYQPGFIQITDSKKGE